MCKLGNSGSWKSPGLKGVEFELHSQNLFLQVCLVLGSRQEMGGGKEVMCDCCPLKASEPQFSKMNETDFKFLSLAGAGDWLKPVPWWILGTEVQNIWRLPIGLLIGGVYPALSFNRQLPVLWEEEPSDRPPAV